MDSLTIQGNIFEIAQAQGWQERFRRAPNLGCRGLIAAATLFALLSFSSRPAWAQNATTGTTIYGTGQSGTTWTGGTISPGATLRLDDGAAVSGAPVANGTLQFNQSAGTLTISSAVSGTGTLSVTNTGTLNLTGVSAASTIALDMTTSASSGVLQMGGGSYSLRVGNSGAGTLNVTGGYVSNNNGYIGYTSGISGTANVSSGTWANSGELIVGRRTASTLNVTGGYVSNLNGTIGGNATAEATAIVSGGTWANSGNLTIGQSSTLTINGGLVSVGLNLNAYGNINLNSGGTLQIGVGGAGGALGASTFTNNGTLIFNSSDASTYPGYSGIISGTGAVTKLGTGTLTLSGSNRFTGATAVNGGVLAYGASNVLSDSTAVTVAGGTLRLGSYSDTVGSFTITSGSVAGSGKLTAATYVLGGGSVAANLGSGAMAVSANSSLSGTADVTSLSLNSGTLTLGSAGRLTSNQVALTGSSGAGLSLGGNESVGSLAGGFNVALGSGTLTTGNDNTSTTYAGVLSGSGGLTKAGSGALTLSGSNRYSGITTVSAGELKVNGSTGTGALTVASAAILSGTGTISGATTISGTHMPGNSPGVQTFASDLTYTQVGLTGPKVIWELAGNTASNSPLAYDQINVGGNLNFNAGTGLTLSFGGAVNWSHSFWSTNEQWTIYQVGGTTSNFSNLLLAASDWSDANGNWFSILLPGSTFSLLQVGSNVILQYSAAAVPEIDPSSLGSALALLIGSLGLIAKRSSGIAGRSLAA